MWYDKSNWNNWELFLPQFFPHNMHYVNLTSYAGKGAGKEGRVVVATMSEVETHSFLQTSMDL
jgi:hypothetical protein